jgi:hypothetical protein
MITLNALTPRRVDRTISPKMNLGALPSVVEGGAFDSAFSRSFRIHGNHSPAVITVQPSIPAIHCKALDNLSKACYSVLCILSHFLADLPPLVDLHPLFFSSLTIVR